MPRLAMNSKTWNRPRGENLLDGGCPYYDTYETKDGEFMAVGALEPQFFAALLQGLSIAPSSLPGRREDRTTWPALRELLTQTFLSKTRKQWECIFDRTDACVTPVLSQPELERTGFLQRPAVTLKSTPGFGIAKGRADRRVPAEGQGCGVKGEGWEGQALAPGEGGEEVLSQWLGWRKGKDFDIQDGGLVRKESLVEKVLARL
ncbi:MAG: hypothetical protein M1827_000179 [Pycnora praestabilis]|nr:MAG: hypothetical protein M1827_000179 [Pycnora praestabilis]